MKKTHAKIHELWIDECLAMKNSPAQNKQNQNTVNLNQQLLRPQRPGMNEDSNVAPRKQVSFGQRFKDKLFAFNKIGKICKLQNNNSSLRGSLILKLNSRINMKNESLKTIFLSKKYNESKHSTNYSIDKNQSKRIAKSLDSSKISIIDTKKDKYRYGSDCYSIKQQQIQETAMKIQQTIGRTYTPLISRRNKCNILRKFDLQDQNKLLQPDQSLLNKCAPFFRNSKTNEQNNIKIETQTIQSIYVQPRELADLKDKKTKSKAPTNSLNNPKQAIPNRNICNNGHLLTKDIQKPKQILPKIKFPRIKNYTKASKQQPLTIR